MRRRRKEIEKRNSPLTKDRGELEAGTFVSGAGRGLSFPVNPKLILRLNKWTVPLSLETASHCMFSEKARLYISAWSAPLLTYMFIIKKKKKSKCGLL